MDYSYDRKLEVNEWIITTRWFYMVAVFLIGILGNSLISLFAVKFTFFWIAFLLLIYLIINFYLYRVLLNIKKHHSESKLKLLSVGQIVIELIIFAIFMQLVGEKSIASVFFFLPIISASIIFGTKGAIFTAIASAALINIAVVQEYMDVIINSLVNRDVFSVTQFVELRMAVLSLVNIIVTSNFYLVLALVASYSFRLIFKREQKLIAQAEQLNLEKKIGEKEAAKLDQNARLLKEQDQKLKAINIELAKRLNQLKNSEKSIIRAFADLQNARKKTEAERNKTAAIISNFIDPIIVIDNDKRIDLLNPAAREIFGFDNDHIGQIITEENNYSMNNFKDIIEQDFDVKTAAELKTSNTDEEEVAIIIGGQELTYKVITAKVVDTDKKHIGVMKIFYNLTREKMIDKLKSEFISIAAHQLRTPLSAIKWVIKMILDGDVGELNEEQRKFLTKGYLSNERIINLVNDMLNVSRIEEGRFGYTFEKENLDDLVKEVASNVQNTFEAKKIKLKIEMPDKLPLILMDRQKMDLVLTNLLENAVKYTPESGTVEICVEAGEAFIKVRVRDNGVGIPEKDKPKLFSKFFRADNVVRMQTEGSGLGLFMVKNIIKRHGGEITFESEEGKGTEFVFALPINVK